LEWISSGVGKEGCIVAVAIVRNLFVICRKRDEREASGWPGSDLERESLPGLFKHGLNYVTVSQRLTK